MTSKLDLKEEWEALSNIKHVASSILHTITTKHNLPPLPPPDSNLAWPNLVLPFPHELLAEISSLQISTKLRESILQLLHSRITQLQQEYIASYNRTCVESSRARPNFSHDFRAIHQVFQASSERHYLPTVKGIVSSVLTQVANYHKPAPHEVKRSFNAEYTPFLEKYFELNAYPSAQHQTILAEEFMMTRRQIEVWFQNHRNRAKKDNRTLRRNTTDLPLRLVLNVLQEKNVSQLKRATSPSGDDSSVENTDVEEDTPLPTSCIDAFGGFRPEHAFPALYPYTGSDPFPSENGTIRFPPPTWRRQPAGSPTVFLKCSSVDIDELCGMFHHKLNVLEGTRKRATSSKTSKTPSPWFSAIVTVPPRAPHPASIQVHSSPSSTIPRSSLSTSSFQLSMGSRSKSTSSAFLSPPQPEAAKIRKISPLPRRIPRSYTATAPSSPNQSISRMSSFDSEYSSRSRSSSSSSPNRTPEPTTPPQLPILDIPAIQDVDHVRQRPDEFDFSTWFGGGPDLFTTTSSGSLGMPPSVNLTADKQPPNFPIDFNSLMTFPAPSYIQARS